MVRVLFAVFVSLAVSVPAAAIDCPGGTQNSSGLNSGTGNLATVKLALHAEFYNDLKTCTVSAPSTFCCHYGVSGLITEWPIGVRTTAYIVALDIPASIGLQRATFGLDYEPLQFAQGTYFGIYMAGFQTCSGQAHASGDPDPKFPSEPGSGVELALDSCQQTVDPGDPQGEAMAVLGWLDVTAYSPGPLTITPRLYLANPDFHVTGCGEAAASHPCYPSFAGSLGFGGPGYDPCQPIGDCLFPYCPPPPVPPLCSAVTVRESTWGAIKRRMQ